jgi:hypothetical protein
MMTEEEFNELLSMDKTTIVKAVSTKFATNPVFLDVIEKLIDDKLYSGAMINPDVNVYGNNNKTALDVVVNAITQTLIDYYSSPNPLLPGASNVSTTVVAIPTATNTNAALNVLANAIMLLPGGVDAIRAASATQVGA